MSERVRPLSDDGWGRARRAFSALVADSDPFRGDLPGGVVDLRPGFTEVELDHATSDGAFVVVSAPSDLFELRELVERLTGPGTWPVSELPPGYTAIETRTSELLVERPTPVVSLVNAMEPRIEDRSRAWRTWKTLIDSLAAGIPAGMKISIEAVLANRV